ncbi:unnamed protein product [Moneuplotes crassus]|uniref:Uncharacterized protein n=1 Tax=Euplotes crassus TaxID=5936 RepID=A0AAD1XNS4_EUPCR|nr:unnamed protein product [Moneuplotes crassus]
MHTLKPLPVEGNLNNNAYSNRAVHGTSTPYSQSSAKSTGSRRNAEMFYGMEPGELSKSSYARMKTNLKKEASNPPRIRSSAFRIDTGLKQSPEFNKAEKAFYLQSEPASRGSRQVNSREDRLRSNKLAQAGNQLMKKQEDTESRKYKRAQKAFYLLPSSAATSQMPSRPPSQQNAGDQMMHLQQITGGAGPYGPARGSSKRFDSSASYKAAKKAFFLVDSQRSQARTELAKSSSSVHDELPINNKIYKNPTKTMKNSLYSIKEESTGFGKKAALYRNTMMTPNDRNNGGFEYDILTCSYRPKV